MATLRKFAAAALPAPPKGFEQYFSKPDKLLESYELRRLKVPKRKDGQLPETDLFEYYWAHQMSGNTVGHVLPLLRTFMFRLWRNVPRSLRLLYVVLWALAVLAAAVIGVRTIGHAYVQRLVDIAPAIFGPVVWLASLVASISAASTLGIVALLLGRRIFLPAIRSTFVDVARYLNPSPGNIEVRHKIRDGAVQLLDRLHEMGKYDRIIVVGHSLGSIIALDAISILWSNHHKRGRNVATPKPAVMARLEACAGELADAQAQDRAALSTTSDQASAEFLKVLDVDKAREAYRDAQEAMFLNLIENGSPWRISDFVSLGSPLAHAHVFMARNRDDLQRQRVGRDLPACPPESEPIWRYGQPRPRAPGDPFSLSYTYSGAREARGEPLVPPRRVLHHGAAFGPTRWTNIWFEPWGSLLGDWFGGPLAPNFGNGIVDRRITAGSWRRYVPVWPHTHYFDGFVRPAAPAKAPSSAVNSDGTVNCAADRSDIADPPSPFDVSAGMPGTALHLLRAALSLNDQSLVERAHARVNAGRIDLNTASIAELQRIKGIKQDLSAAIVAYRSTLSNGFENVAQLRHVRGIGAEIVERIEREDLAFAKPLKRASAGATVARRRVRES